LCRITGVEIGTSGRDVPVRKSRSLYVLQFRTAKHLPPQQDPLPCLWQTALVLLAMQRLLPMPWRDLFHERSFLSDRLLQLSDLREKRGRKETIFFSSIHLEWCSSVHRLSSTDFTKRIIFSLGKDPQEAVWLTLPVCLLSDIFNPASFPAPGLLLICLVCISFAPLFSFGVDQLDSMRSNPPFFLGIVSCCDFSQPEIHLRVQRAVPVG